MRSIIKNKRGDIAITILVIGVFLICTYALISFFIYNNRATKRTAETDIVEKLNSQLEKYYLYQNMGYSESQITSLLGIQTDALGRRYLSAEKTDKNEKKLISAKYILE